MDEIQVLMDQLDAMNDSEVKNAFNKIFNSNVESHGWSETEYFRTESVQKEGLVYYISVSSVIDVTIYYIVYPIRNYDLLWRRAIGLDARYLKG